MVSFSEASKLARLIRAELEASNLEGVQETISKYEALGRSILD